MCKGSISLPSIWYLLLGWLYCAEKAYFWHFQGTFQFYLRWKHIKLLVWDHYQAHFCITFKLPESTMQHTSGHRKLVGIVAAWIKRQNKISGRNDRINSKQMNKPHSQKRLAAYKCKKTHLYSKKYDIPYTFHTLIWYEPLIKLAMNFSQFWTENSGFAISR